jgi:hypothetical protein
MNHTTQTFPRTSRPSGTEYASSIEHTRRSDVPGKLIVLICMALLGIVWALS